MERSEVLKAAEGLVTGDRATMYGSAKEHFADVAAMWSRVLGVTVDADQVVLCLILLKAARVAETPGHDDSWVDIAGYAALGAEVAEGGTAPSVEMEVPSPIPATTTGHIDIVLPDTDDHDQDEE